MASAKLFELLMHILLALLLYLPSPFSSAFVKLVCCFLSHHTYLTPICFDVSEKCALPGLLRLLPLTTRHKTAEVRKKIPSNYQKKKKYFSGTLRFQFSLFNETYFQVKDKLLLVNLTFYLVSRFLKLEIVPDNKN